jgi:hypothetical protein
MKNLFLILILALNLSNCKAQQQQSIKLIIPKIDNTFKTFDIEKYMKNLENKTHSGKKTLLFYPLEMT